MASSSMAQAPTHHDFPLSSPPSESISCIDWSPTGNYLASTSWDGTVCVWQVDPSRSQSNPIYSNTFAPEKPLLTCRWSPDGTKLATGGADNAVQLYDLTSRSRIQVAAHDAPVSGIRFFDQNIIVTSSWDGTVRAWDVRSAPAPPVYTMTMPGNPRIYGLDMATLGNNSARFVVATSSKENIYTWTFPDQAPQQQQQQPTQPSPLALPLEFPGPVRSVSINSTGTNIALCTGIGRVTVYNLNPTNRMLKFESHCFKAHCLGLQSSATVPRAFPVNTSVFTPSHSVIPNMLLTGGTDGKINFWDYASRLRTRYFDTTYTGGVPITSMCLNFQASHLAYAVSYDWSRGHEGNNYGIQNQIRIITLTPDMRRKKQ